MHYVGFSHQKSKYMFDFRLDSVQKRRFFFFLATLHSQKIGKEIAYILTCYEALLKAQLLKIDLALFTRAVITDRPHESIMSSWRKQNNEGKINLQLFCRRPSTLSVSNGILGVFILKHERKKGGLDEKGFGREEKNRKYREKNISESLSTMVKLLFTETILRLLARLSKAP